MRFREARFGTVKCYALRALSQKCGRENWWACRDADPPHGCRSREVVVHRLGLLLSLSWSKPRWNITCQAIDDTRPSCRVVLCLARLFRDYSSCYLLGSCSSGREHPSGTCHPAVLWTSRKFGVDRQYVPSVCSSPSDEWQSRVTA